MTIAYSYKRFSTPSQSRGDSLLRQTELARRYCEENGLTLSDENFHDLGVSGYSGANLAEGSGLGSFLEAVESGRIASGSFLLIEAFDRLTRLTPAKALQLLMKLLADGITVVTLQDGKRYSSDSMASDLGSLMMSVMGLFVGHEESRRKSLRLSSVYARKREQGDTRIRLPYWLERTKSGGLAEKAHEGGLVRRIFKLAAEEGLGARAIARQLNAEGLTSASGGAWSHSSINRILGSRSVLGEYVPHSAAMGSTRQPVGPAILGFYPQLIDHATFARANNLRRASGPKLPHVGPRNLFSGLVICTCGRPVHFKRASKRDAKDRLVCPAKCGAKSISYEEFEAVTVFGFVEALQARVDEQRPKKAVDQGERAQIDEIENKIGNIVRAIEHGGDTVELVARLRQLQLQRAQLEERLSTQLEEEDDELGGFATWRAVVGQEYIRDRDDPLYRRKLESLLRRWIQCGVLEGVEPHRCVVWTIIESKRKVMGETTRKLPTRFPSGSEITTAPSARS